VLGIPWQGCLSFLSWPIREVYFAASLSQRVQVKISEKYFSVVTAAELLNVICQNPMELIFDIRGTI
jgi:hypothetical protein